jgi:hypothetical protein
MKYLIRKGEGHSHATELNLVAQEEKIFVIDNHLAAFWCWHQLDLSSKYNLLHVDRHYDLVRYFPEYDLSVKKQDWKNMPVEKVTQFKRTGGGEGQQLIRWDNYIHLFNTVNPRTIDFALFCTQKDGDFNYSKSKCKEVEVYDLFNEIVEGETSWIFNIDIDFFFTHVGDQIVRVFSDSFIDCFGRWLKEESQYATQIIICLSPECCGGWKEAKKVANIILKHFMIII